MPIAMRWLHSARGRVVTHTVDVVRSVNVVRTGKGQRLWGSPAWRTHIWGMATWAVINGALWFCFVWWLIGETHTVWIIGAAIYGSLILFHGIISSRFG